MSKASPQAQTTTALTVRSTLESNGKSLSKWVPREMVRSDHDRAIVCGEVMRHAEMQCTRIYKPDEPLHPIQAQAIYLSSVTFMQARVIPNQALGLGYFVPFNTYYKEAERKLYTVTPVFGYKGLRQCVGREAGIRVAQAEIVVKGDRWETAGHAGIPMDAEAMARLWQPGDNHTPDADPSLWLAGFSRMRWPDMFEDVFIMGGAELRSRRQRAMANKSRSPWDDNGVLMAAKTVMRRHITSGRIEMAGDGFAPVADGLAEAGKLRQLAEVIASRDGDASVQERDSLVQNAIDVEEDERPAPNGKRTLDDLAGGQR